MGNRSGSICGFVEGYAVKPMGLAIYLRGALQGIPLYMGESDTVRIKSQWEAAREHQKVCLLRGSTSDGVSFSFWSEDVTGLHTLTQNHVPQQQQQGWMPKHGGPGMSGVN